MYGLLSFRYIELKRFSGNRIQIGRRMYNGEETNNLAYKRGRAGSYRWPKGFRTHRLVSGIFVKKGLPSFMVEFHFLSYRKSI